MILATDNRAEYNIPSTHTLAILAFYRRSRTYIQVIGNAPVDNLLVFEKELEPFRIKYSTEEEDYE